MNSQRKRIGQIYMAVLAICSGLWLVLNIIDITLPANLVIGIFALAIVILGVPHGALDYFFIEEFCKQMPATKMYSCLAVYLGIAVISVYLWFLLPLLCLCLFLIISIYHFSCDWRHQAPILFRLAVASSVICTPAIFHNTEIIDLFSALLVTVEQSTQLVLILQILGSASAIIAILYLIFAALRAPYVMHHYEIMGLLLSAIFLHPLLHFTLYFCLLHSTKHIEDFFRSTKTGRKNIFVITTIIVFLTILLAFLIPIYIPAESFTEITIQMIFISLFGLTMAHMGVISLWHRKGG